MIFVLMMLSFADRLILGIAAVRITADLQLSQTQFGMLGSAFFLCYSLAAALFGRLADHHRPATLLGWLGIGAALSHAPVLLSASFAGALVSRILLGAAQGPVVPLGLHVTFGWFGPAERGWPTSIVVAGTAAGATFGAPLLSWIITHWGWRSAYAALAAALLLWGLAWRAMPQGERVGEIPPAPSVAPDRASGTSAFLEIASIIAAAAIAHGVGLIGVLWAAPFLQYVGRFSLTAAAWQISLNALGIMAATFLFGWVVRAAEGSNARPLARALPGLLQLLGGLALAGTGALQFGPLSLLLMLLGFALIVSIFVLAPPRLASLAPPGRQASLLGLYGGCYVLGGLVSPLLMGRFLDHQPDMAAGLRMGFVLVGAIAGASGAMLMLVAALRRGACIPALPSGNRDGTVT